MPIENDSKKFYETTGANIKKYRDMRNYSLQVLAEKVGLTKKTIQRYENGVIKIDMNRLKDLADALDVPVTKLTEGTDIFLGNEFVVKETPATYAVNERELSNDMKLLNDLKKLADSYQMDLSDPKTFDTLKDALDLIKRVRGE